MRQPQDPNGRTLPPPAHLLTPTLTQLFLAFNATAHALIATNLSRRAEGRAAEVLLRIAQLAVAVALPLGAALFASRALLPDLFTQDALVRQEVAQVLPLLLIIMVRYRRGAWCWR